MKREVKLLRTRSVDSLLLSVEHFNRISDRGRAEVVLILMDRAYELLFKAVILHKGGRVRERRAKETIGFDACVRKCLSDAAVKCLTEEQALTAQVINSLRDAAQHYILEISEQQLYLYCQAGLTLFEDIHDSAFGGRLRDELPERVLPITASPPSDLATLIHAEFEDIKRLAQPGARQRLIAAEKVRPIAIVEASVTGIRSQPSPAELDRLVTQIAQGTSWEELFPGIATLRLDTEGTGLSVTLRISKGEGEPVRLVPEGTPGATVVAVHKVDVLGFYSLGLTQLAAKLKLTQPKTGALIRHLRIQDDPEAYREVQIGTSTFKRYSSKALDALKKALPTVDMAEVWREHRPQPRPRR